MPEKRDIRLFLLDVSESIERIDDYTSEMTYEDFLEDRKTIDAVVRNFEIIGEASKNIPDHFKEKYPDEGIDKHDKLLEKHLLEREEEFIDVATEIEKALETGITRKVRELDVKNEDLIGRIDEVQFSPHGILIIDDKPGNRVFNSHKLQVWGYCVAFRDNYSPNLPLSAGLRNRDNGNMIWEKEFTAEHQQIVMDKIERLRAILNGGLVPHPAHPRRCSKCRLKQVCKDNLEKERERLDKEREPESQAVESLKSKFMDLIRGLR